MSLREPDEILQGLLRRLDDRPCLPGRLLEHLVVWSSAPCPPPGPRT